MNTQSLFPLGGGIAGAIATVLTYNKPSNRLVDNIVVPIGGFLGGGQVGSIVGTILSDAPADAKLAAVAVDAVSLGAGVWAFSAWREGSKHSDAGAVGIALLATIGTNVVLNVVDGMTTKLLPPRQLY
jgi:uncharacterized membrane protein YeaQ/YmgE (transglycosylase-associated protein family)